MQGIRSRSGKERREEMRDVKEAWTLNGGMLTGKRFRKSIDMII